MSKTAQILPACIALFMASSVSAQDDAAADVRRQVEDTERAFARTMADRDHVAFTSFVAEEAIFFSGEEPLRGRQQVADAWKPFFDGPDAPFSWEPKTVEVLQSGGLALSSGPVYDPGGRRVATFTSIWRLEAPGRWRIIFDKGSKICEPPAPAKPDS